MKSSCGVSRSVPPAAAVTALVAVATLALLARSANAALISVDIHAGYRATVSTDLGGGHFVGDVNAAGQNSTDDQIGVWGNGLAAENWWNYVGYNATGLRDADRNVTGVSYSTTVSSAAMDWTAGTPNDDLVSDGVYLSTQDQSFTTTISGLVPGVGYNLLVYHADDYPSETVTVNGQAATNHIGLMANTYQDAFDGVPGSDFWYFKDVAADASGQLAISSGGNGFNTITGFQLVPEPCTAVLLAMGMLGLLLMRRRG